jgi:hypothetical protein
MEKLKNIATVVAFILLLVVYAVLLEEYPLFRLNAIIATIIIVSWSFSISAFGYPTKYMSYTDWVVGHELKHYWISVMIISTLFCFPIGMIIRKIYYSKNTRIDGSFTEKFYLFFERESTVF